METLRVLIIEDEAPMRAAVLRSLSRFTLQLPDIEGEFRFEVSEAGSAEDGLAIIETRPPDIVLLDHQLPGMSGVDLLGLLADRPVDFLTVMMTAYATLENAIVATKRGAFDFLAKPFTPDELKAVVSKTTRHLLLTRETRRLAQEKRQVRFQLLSVIVHELKAPLAAIQGYLYILKDKSLSGDPAVQERALDRSLVRIEGMRKLIMDLLDLTRLESGQKVRRFETVDLRETARACMETLLPEAATRNITLALHADEPVLLTADRGEMEIVLNNLLTNAVKYNRDGGRVDIRLGAKDGRVKVEVEDTGIGMSEEESGRLFQEFVRIKNERTRNILGSGLGLSILRKLVQLYDGDCTVKSAPDVGSTFTVEMSQTPSAEFLAAGAAALGAQAAPGPAPAPEAAPEHPPQTELA
ncbi:MAG: response regulator [Candidatus Eisenbacteria bacterium]|nr:response regulator [Candidatus Eisenbacteria bacterium]